MTNSTNFRPKQTVIPAAWLNDVNASVYGQVANVVLFGAKGNLSADDTVGALEALASLAATGGILFFPPNPGYVLNPAPGSTNGTALLIPDNVMVVCSAQFSGSLVPGSNNMSLIRFIGKNGGMNNVGFKNLFNVSGSSAIRLAPIDESSTTIHSDIEFNRINNIAIQGFDDAIVLAPGPKVGSQDSYMYYNTFSNIEIRNCKRNIWLKDTINGGAGANGNNFFAVRCGQSGANTGLQIDLGSENNFYGLALEGIESGTSPNATPTAIYIATGTSASTANNTFHGTRIEGCTLDIELNQNKTTQFYGIENTGTINGTPGIFISSAGIAYHGKPISNGGRLFIDFPANGDGIQLGSPDGDTLNNFLSADISPDGGPYGTIGFKYGGNALLTWGGPLSSYAGDARLNVPSGSGSLLLGANQTDRWEINSTGNLLPKQTSTLDIGSASKQVNNIYLVSAPIVSSDREAKDQIDSVDEKVLSAWSKVNYSQYKYKNAIKKKKGKARLHVGIIAQEIEDAFRSEGLDAFDYGLLCKEKVDGKEVYGVRYEEILSLECAYLRSLIKK